MKRIDPRATPAALRERARRYMAKAALYLDKARRFDAAAEGRERKQTRAEFLAAGAPRTEDLCDKAPFCFLAKGHAGMCEEPAVTP